MATKITGEREVRAKIRKLQDSVSKNSAKSDLKGFHAEGAKIVERDAVSRAPVRGGGLRSSLRSSGTQRSGVVRAGRASIPYAGPIHFGWRARNIRPQPFMYDALDARRDEVVKVFDKGVADLIRKYKLD
jgi:HK97 gp10 family phage protein